MSNANQMTPPQEGREDKNYGVLLTQVGFEAKPRAAQLEEQDKYDRMRAPQRFKPELMTEDDLNLEILKKIPLISGLLKRLDDIGENLTRIKEIEQASNLSKQIHAFQYAGLVLNVLNFLYIPILYMAAFIYNTRMPFTIPNNLKFAYASVLVALSSIALAIPVTAPFISIAVSGSALLIAIGLVYKHYSSRMTIKTELKNLNQLINTETEAMATIQEDARVLTVGSPELDALFEQFEQKRKVLQTLHNKKAQREQIYNSLSWDEGLIKAASVAVGAMLVAGVTLSIFFPPLGLTITVAAAGAGCSLVFVSISKLIFNRVMDYFKTKKENISEIVDSSPLESEEPELSEVDTPAHLSAQLSIQPAPADQLLKESKQTISKPLKTAPSIPSPLPENDEEEGEGEHPHP